ncbi:MAG: PEP-CTERM sorting domain-containing protein [Planctomycetota bacterium]
MKSKEIHGRGKGRMCVPILPTLFIIIVTMVLANSASGSPIIIEIDDVDITPQEPTMLDLININVSGGASGGGSYVEHSEFSQSGTSLQLDLFVDVGDTTIPSTWSHLEQIGPFSAETYGLTVNVFEYQDGTFKDTYTQDIVITPEPSTIGLLGLGALALTKRKK